VSKEPLSAVDKEPELCGLLLVDKQASITSHDLVARVRKIASQKKVGHIGTLDPMATGLMGLLLGWATKLEPWLIKHDKVYLAKAQLGLITDTLDITGQILEQRPGPWPGYREMEQALKAMEGASEQRPPAFSAIKVNGRAAYKAARSGQEVILALRKVEAYKLTLIDWRPPLVTLEARVSSGYYVRSLARDLGQFLGLGGGALTSLRRLALGPFDLSQSFRLEGNRAQLAQRLIEPRLAAAHLKEIYLDPPLARRLGQGQTILAPEGLENGTYKIIGKGETLLAIAEISSPPLEAGRPRRPFLRPLRVFGLD
jgi:tRNA pseudouridine55 synthase